MTDIKQLREDLNLSQQDVAVMLDVSRVTYIKWEQNIDLMPHGKFIQLHKELVRLKSMQGEFNGME